MNDIDNSTFDLYYVLDPMCSWCYAFADSWESLKQQLPDDVRVHRILGGLASDSDDPMPDAQQIGIAATWRNIESRTGVSFNHDFWELNEPRRSTYPACRAVIAAENLNTDSAETMIKRIQQGYYQQAKNPSNVQVLCEFAEEIGIDAAVFKTEIMSDRVEQELQRQLVFAKQIGIRGFPGIVAAYKPNDDSRTRLAVVTAGYCDADTLLYNWNNCRQGLYEAE